MGKVGGSGNGARRRTPLPAEIGLAGGGVRTPSRKAFDRRWHSNLVANIDGLDLLTIPIAKASLSSASATPLSMLLSQHFQSWESV